MMNNSFYCLWDPWEWDEMCFCCCDVLWKNENRATSFHQIKNGNWTKAAGFLLLCKNFCFLGHNKNGWLNALISIKPRALQFCCQHFTNVFLWASNVMNITTLICCNELSTRICLKLFNVNTKTSTQRYSRGSSAATATTVCIPCWLICIINSASRIGFSLKPMSCLINKQQKRFEKQFCWITWFPNFRWNKQNVGQVNVVVEQIEVELIWLHHSFCCESQN